MTVIRRLTVDDAEAWRTIRLRGLQTDPIAFGATYEEGVKRPLDWFRDMLTGEGPTFAAFDGGSIIGTAGCYFDGGPKATHRGHIWAMYVAPEHRRKGIGRAVLEAVIAEVMPRVDQLHLGVVTENTSAYNLYRQFGFTAYGIDPRAMRQNGRDYDLILMVKVLR